MSDTSSSTGLGFRTALRWLLGAALMGAGVGHLTVQRTEFRAQVPSWFPIDEDVVVIVSGLVEIALGLALIALPRHRVVVGWIVAGFFVVIFPGNVAQWREGVDAFGLDTDAKRFVRLFFQPVLVGWALWATGATSWWRSPRSTTTDARSCARSSIETTAAAIVRRHRQGTRPGVRPGRTVRAARRCRRRDAPPRRRPSGRA
jgi:uncharacterized membrane protein